MKTKSQLPLWSGCCFSPVGLVLALSLTGSSLLAATIVKTNNNASLNTAASWTNNVVPGPADTAQWDATVASAANCTSVLGGNLTWSNLTILNPATPVQINADGNTLTLTNLSMGSATVDLTLNCGLAVYGSPTWQIGPSGGGRTLTLGSAVTGSGSIKQQYGKILLAPGTGSLPGTMAYSFSGTGTLDLGGNNQTLASVGPAWGATSIISNGVLNITGAGNFTPQGASTVDFSGLTAFTNNAPTTTFTVQNNAASGANTVAMNLARTGAGANFIAVNNLLIGNSTAAAGSTSIFNLGRNNLIYTPNLQLAGYKLATCTLAFPSGLSNPTLTLRGQGGTNRVGSITLGYCNTGASANTGNLDATLGTIDCQATNVTMAGFNSGSSVYGNLYVSSPASLFDALNLTLAQKDAGTAANVTAQATVFQNGGTVKAQTLTFGNVVATNTVASAIKAGYNLNGGVLRAQTIQPGTDGTVAFSSGSYRTLFWTNGVIQNYDSATPLTVLGGGSTPMLISAPGTGNRSFTVDAGLTNTIQCALNQASATATPIVKDGAGALDLQGTTDNPWLMLNVSNGVVILDKTSSSSPSVHAIGNGLTLNGGKVLLAGTGGDQIYNGNLVTINNGTFDVNGQQETIGGLAGTGGTLTDSSPYGGTLTVSVASGTNFAFGGSLSGTANLTKSGAGKQTLFGTDSRVSGANDVAGGTLEIGNGGATASLGGSTTTVETGAALSFNCAGTLNVGGNLMGTGDVQQNGTGTLVLSADYHTGSTLVNAGTLQVPAGAYSLAGSVITVAPGATLDLTPGAGVAFGGLGYPQTLTGAGTVKGSFFLGNGCVLSGLLAVNNGSVTTGDSSTNAPGGFFKAGTLTITGNYTNGNNSCLIYDLTSNTAVGGGTNDLLAVSGNFDLSQPCTLLINGTPVSGTYTLATFGSFSGSAANLTVQGSTRYTFTPQVSGLSLLLVVSGNGGNLVWRGDGLYNYWDANSANQDWFNLGTSALDAFNPGDNVTFDDTSANPTVYVTASVLPNSLTVNAANNYTFVDGGGSIDGPVALTKTNSGTLTVQNNNTFTGPVNLNGGTVSVGALALNGSASPLGAGTTLNFNGGTLQYTGPAVGVGGFNRQLVLGPNGGTIDQESSGGIYLFLTNRITGAGNLTKAGPQQLIIGDVSSGTGSNDYAGITYINNGNLQLRNPYGLGSTTAKTVINAGASLSADGGFTGVIMENIDLAGGNLQGGPANYNYGGVITLVSNSLVGSGSPITISGTVTGPAQLQKSGNGTLTLLNSANTYAGGTYIAAGTLQLGTNGATGWIAPQPAGVAITNNGTLSFNLATTNALSDRITGTGGITQAGSGTTILTDSNDFTGNVTVNAGVLRAAATSALGQGRVYLPGANNYGTLELTGNCTVSNTIQLPMHNSHTPPHIRNVAGTNTILGTLDLQPGGAEWDISSDGGYLILGANIVPSASSGGGWRTLYLSGAAGGKLTGIYDQSLVTGTSPNVGLDIMGGTWTLASTNNYGGTTTVDAGATLLAANTPEGSATGTGNVSVNGTLGGNGYLAGPVTINSAGTLSPGLGVGTLSCNSNLTLAGSLFIELNKALVQSNDFVQVAGGLTNSGTGTVLVTNLGPALAVGDTFYLFNKAVVGGQNLAISNATPGVTWQNNLAVDGSISVSAILSDVPPPPPAVLSSAARVGANLQLVWAGGTNASCILLSSTNVALPRSSWLPVATNFVGANGLSTNSFPVNPGEPRRFYLLSIPYN